MQTVRRPESRRARSHRPESRHLRLPHLRFIPSPHQPERLGRRHRSPQRSHLHRTESVSSEWHAQHHGRGSLQDFQLAEFLVRLPGYPQARARQ